MHIWLKLVCVADRALYFIASSKLWPAHHVIYFGASETASLNIKKRRCKPANVYGRSFEGALRSSYKKEQNHAYPTSTLFVLLCTICSVENLKGSSTGTSRPNEPNFMCMHNGTVQAFVHVTTSKGNS
jgi:hypothetical protein